MATSKNQNSKVGTNSEIRLQKVLADAGIASRRASEEIILDGRVSVNGRIVRTLGSKINPEKDEVLVDGEPITTKKSNVYLAFYKPQGILSTMTDPEGRPALGDFFTDRSERLFHVGRLDKESEGLILLTNDGDLAHKATHPSFGLTKKYVVEALGTTEKLSQVLKGVELEDGMARAISYSIIRSVSPEHHWIEIEIHEGRYHIVRRMLAVLDLEVVRLIRSEFGPIGLGDLKAGRWRYLSNTELINLENSLSS
jgi:23S rRNA pseudouridine2605 synthase